jgi:hypothetical protein
MKKITSISFVLLLLLFNCHDTKDATTENQVSPFNKNVGKKISMEQAQRWIVRYEESTSSSRTETAQQLTATTLSEILSPITEKLGVSFHRAIDQTGAYHILVVPVKQGQPVWDSEHILDANSSAEIDPQTARNWTDRYKAENPNGVWSHFFGIHVFERDFTTIDLAEATNDQGRRQLLLFIWRIQSVDNGRSQGEIVDVYDASAPCPPTCNASEI